MVDERAYIVHRVVRGGIELDDVVGTLFVESSARFAFVAGFSRFGRVETVDCFSENTGTRSFSYAARAAKQISMSEFVRVDRIFQSLCQCFLSYDRTERRWSVFSCRNDIIVHIDFLSSFANIVKGERRGKRKLHFRLDYAEPPPIFYKYNEGRESDNNECICFFELHFGSLPLPCPVTLWGVTEEILGECPWGERG